MLNAYAVVSSLIALMICYSAALKLTHRPQVVESYRRAGVPDTWLNSLAVLLFGAAAALVSGIWLPVAGIAAAAGLLGYFVVAVWFHIRAKDMAHAAMPTVLAVLAGAALAVRLVAVI
jgi:DoxX-like protein